MEQLYRFIFLFFVLTVFFQCSSIRKATEATNQVSQSSASEALSPDTERKETALPDTISTPPATPFPEIQPPDSTDLGMATDSLKAAITSDSLSINKQDSLSINAADSVSSTEEQKLEAAVFYTAQDSMVFTSDNMGYLYGDADIKYGEMGIKGEYITMNMDSSIISSTFGLDSLGKEFGLPVFSEGGTEYEMKKVRYNFETRKAFINNVVTQQGEGNIVANEAKMNADNSFYMRNAKYTTCDRYDHPHFYLNLSKAKVRPDKDVVTGPAWLVVADVPLFPVVLPFAFSLSQKRIHRESLCPAMAMR
jgi:lipopolysaccharide assembly outer membrane protein LptD (OstA)